MIHDEVESDAPADWVTRYGAYDSWTVLFSDARLCIQHEGQVALQDPRFVAATESREQGLTVLS